MNIFDPVAVAKAIVAQYKPGDTIPADEVCKLLDTRLPRDDDTWAVAKDLLFQHLNRAEALRNELLRTHKILAVRESSALVLVAPAHHVARALQRVRKKVAKVLQRGALEVANLDMTGLSNVLIAEQHDAQNYLDTLRWAYSKPRRIKMGSVTPIHPAPLPPATPNPPSRRYPAFATAPAPEDAPEE